MNVRPFARHLRSRAAVVEAAVLIGMAAVAQRWVPMPRWSIVLGAPGTVPASMSTSGRPIPMSAATPTEARVGSAIHRAARRLPWEASCLAQATAGQIMLRLRGEPGVVVIGLRPPEETPGDWSAHAWLLGGAGALTGGPAAAGFTPTTVFGIMGAE